MSQKIKYLYDNHEIAQILAQGFAKICQQKPKFPINYLARHLKNHNINNQQKTAMIDKLQHNTKIQQVLLKNQKNIQLHLQSLLQKQQALSSQQAQFLKKLQECQRHQQFLDKFCTWVNARLQTAAFYIGELESQTKKINTAEEDGQDAHVQLQKEKIIKFKYASEQQARVIVGKVLNQDSFVGKLLSQSSTEAQPPAQQENAENQQTKKQQKIKGQAYIPSVVGNQQLKFFTFPKLGAYFASAVTIKTYLIEKLFDENLVKVQTHKKVMKVFEKQMQEKQAKFKEVYDQRSNAGADQKQLQDLEKQFERQKAEIPSPKMEQLACLERKFIFCVDTLGKDRQISETQRTQIREYIKSLKRFWQQKQLQLLMHDIQSQLTLLKPVNQQAPDADPPNYSQQYTSLLEEQEKQIPTHEEVQKVKDNEKLLELQSNTVRINRTKDYIADEKYFPFWGHLLGLNVLKYHQVIKQFLIFLGYKKDDFCIKGTNQLNWHKTKNLLKQNRSTIFEQLASTNVRGSKPYAVLPYAMCARIQKNLQGLDTVAIASYNIYLSFILRLLQLYTKTRVQDRDARWVKIHADRQNRTQKIKQAQEKATQKQQKLQAARQQAQQKGQLQAFDEQAWKTQYDQENPAVEIPEEIGDDVDKDLEDLVVENNVVPQVKE